jgi:hypothetical protein
MSNNNVEKEEKGEMAKNGNVMRSKTDHWISRGSLVVSVLALIVSGASWEFTRESNKLSASIYRQERQLVLLGDFGEKEREIIVRPLDKNKRFLQGNAFFPSQLYPSDVPIGGDGKFHHMMSVLFDIRKLIQGKIPVKKGYVQISEGHIPIIIKSLYATKGKTYEDVSLYVVQVTAVIFEESHKDPSVSFKNLVLMKRMDPRKSVNKEMLNEIWTSGGYQFSSGGP